MDNDVATTLQRLDLSGMLYDRVTDAMEAPGAGVARRLIPEEAKTAPKPAGPQINYEPVPDSPEWVDRPVIAGQLNMEKYARPDGIETKQFNTRDADEMKVYDTLIKDSTGPFANKLLVREIREYNRNTSSWDILTTSQTYRFKNVRKVK